MSILKYIPSEELGLRQLSLRNQIEKVQARLNRPPAFTYYNPRDDLGLLRELRLYLDEVTKELNSRGTHLS